MVRSSQLPNGLRAETTAGRIQLEITDRTELVTSLQNNCGLKLPADELSPLLDSLQPEEQPTFALASNTYVFIPWGDPEQHFLIGAQPDTVKIVPPAIMQSASGLVVPAADLRGRFEPAFPIFRNLAGIVFQNKPVNFIGTTTELARVRRIVDLEFLGVNRQTPSLFQTLR
jgi:hypothetical protein